MRKKTIYVVSVGAVLWRVDSNEVEPFISGLMAVLAVLDPNRESRIRGKLDQIPPDWTAPNRRHATLRACHDANVLQFLATLYEEPE